MTGAGDAERPEREHDPPSDLARRRRREDALLTEYARTRDPRTLEQLTRAFMPLARGLARRYGSAGSAEEDVLQVAYTALIAALERYEPDRGVPFVAFASPTILGELRHFFRDQRWAVRIPRRLQERSSRIAEARAVLASELGRSPSIAQVAERCGLSSEEVLEAMAAEAARRPDSLDQPSGTEDQESSALVELLGVTEPRFDRVESDQAASGALLTSKEARVLVLRYEAGLTQREVSKQLGISAMQVSRLQRSALMKLLAQFQPEQR